MSKINDLKKENEQKIRECFYQQATLTKNEIATYTHISLAKITNVLQDLQNKQEIVFIGENQSTGGRKSKIYQINPDYSHLLTISLNKTQNSMTICVYNLLNELLYKDAISITSLLTQLQDVVKERCLEDQHIQMLCLSIPGVSLNGVVDVCDFKELENKNMNDLFLNIDVVVENDVNVACIGFSYNYPEYQHISFVYQPKSDYVGCGMMIDHKLYNGFSHFAGELRYLPFYSHKQQDEMLENQPELLLTQQIETLICVMNPEIIGVISDVIDETSIQLNIPKQHQPKIVVEKQLDEHIMKGLFHIGMKKQKENGGKK